jgi:hypothetical protein
MPPVAMEAIDPRRGPRYMARYVPQREESAEEGGDLAGRPLEG